MLLGSPIIMSPEKYFGREFDPRPHFQSTAAHKVLVFREFHGALPCAFAWLACHVLYI